jgi:hypothetical protein
MSRSRLTYLLLIPVAFLLMGARAVPLVDPAPIPVPAGLSAKDVSRAIGTGIALRKWVVTKDENGKIDAELHLRDHIARIAIACSTKLVTPTYVSSDNLEYSEKKGVRYIHRNYLNWMKNVETDITNALRIAADQHG